MSTEPTLKLTTQPESDWFLTSIIEFVNKRAIELPITLQIGGFLVSGVLVNYEKYFESVGFDTAEVFGAGELAKSKPNGEAAEQSSPSFIHLKDARIFPAAGQPIPAKKSVWWRGRISEVSGFFFGTLSAKG